MADPPEIRRGKTGDLMNPSLPQGAATAIQEATPSALGEPTAEAAPAAPTESTATAAPLGPPSLPQQPRYTPSSDEEKFMFGPTYFPDEHVTSGIGQSFAPSSEVAQWLPLLEQLANDPTSSEQSRDMFRIVASQAGE